MILSSLKHLILVGLLASTPLLHAAEYLSGPADYVYSPIVEEGEKEIDTKFGTQSPRNGDESRQSGASIGFGYGVNSWWFTEIYGKAVWDGNTSKFDAVEWENKFQPTPEPPTV